MPRRRSRTLTEVELEFMQIVWQEGDITAEELLDALHSQGRNVSDGTVRKILLILTHKGYLMRERTGRGYTYRPKVPEARAKRSLVLDLLKRAFGGSAALMVAALLGTRTVTEEDLAEIKQVIAEHERKERE